VSETRPTRSEWLSKTLARARSRGLSEVAGALRDQLSSKVSSRGTLQFLARDTPDSCPQTNGLIFRAAGRPDAEAYERDIGTDSRATFRARLTDATACYLVVAGDRIVHASWVTTARAWTGELRAFVTPPKGSAYVYESFTGPQERGRGIYPGALRCICADLDARGIHRVYIGVDAANRPSLRAITKASFEPVFSIRYAARLGRFEVGAPEGPHADLARELLSLPPGH